MFLRFTPHMSIVYIKGINLKAMVYITLYVAQSKRIHIPLCVDLSTYFFPQNGEDDYGVPQVSVPVPIPSCTIWIPVLRDVVPSCPPMTLLFTFLTKELVLFRESYRAD